MRARRRLFVVVVAGLIAVGCRSSDRTIKMPGAILETEQVVDLRGGLILAASPDGRYYATYGPLNRRRGLIEIRDYDTQSVKLSWQCNSEDGPVPVMFDRNGTHALLVGFNRKDRDLFSVDLSTGKRVELPRSPVSLTGLEMGDGNDDQSILSAAGRDGSIILTSSGKALRAQGRVSYDVHGDAWFKAGAGWTKVDKGGRESQERTRPAYLVRDQSHERGLMRLIEQATELKHLGANAYLSTIWLENARGIGGKAALGLSLPDVWAYGFVPGRNAVYALTDGGTYIAPYTMRKQQPSK